MQKKHTSIFQSFCNPNKVAFFQEWWGLWYRIRVLCFPLYKNPVMNHKMQCHSAMVVFDWFFHCVFSNVTSSFLPKRMQNHNSSIYLLDFSLLWDIKWDLKSPAWCIVTLQYNGCIGLWQWSLLMDFDNDNGKGNIALN